MSIENIWKKLQRNKRLRSILIASFIILTIFNGYYSLYGVSLRKNDKFNKLFKIEQDIKSYDVFKQDYSNIKQLSNNANIREQLHFQYPYNPKESYPKIIWQTWKYSKTDVNFKSRFKKYSNDWIENNPTYSYQLIPDNISSDFVKHLYGNIPKVYKAYELLPKSILKADFFRYLILFARGGVYSDIDTAGLKPVDSWVSSNSTLFDEIPNHTGLVIGIEADPDREDWNEYYARRLQFCQWTIKSKKGHPMLGELIAKITEITLKKHKNGELKKIIGKDSGDDIMNWTGPGIFTDEVFGYLNNNNNNNNNLKHEMTIINKNIPNDYNKDLDISKEGIDWRFFTLMEEPILIDDVIVLPITSFSPGVGHMGSKSVNHPMAYVVHLFEGSWKPKE